MQNKARLTLHTFDTIIIINSFTQFALYLAAFIFNTNTQNCSYNVSSEENRLISFLVHSLGQVNTFKNKQSIKLEGRLFMVWKSDCYVSWSCKLSHDTCWPTRSGNPRHNWLLSRGVSCTYQHNTSHQETSM